MSGRKIHISLESGCRVLNCVHASSGAVVPGTEQNILDPSINDDGVVEIIDGQVFYEGDVFLKNRLKTKLVDCTISKTRCHGHLSSKRRYSKFIELDCDRQSGLILTLDKIDRRYKNPESSLFDSGRFVRLGSEIEKISSSNEEFFDWEEPGQMDEDEIIDPKPESLTDQKKPFVLVATGYSENGTIYEVYDNGKKTKVKKIKHKSYSA